MSDPAERRRSVRDAIVAHLLKHPAASDTAEGICQWWLHSAGPEDDVRVVEQALEELVGSGVMRRRRLPDGGIVYLGGRRIDQ